MPSGERSAQKYFSLALWGMKVFACFWQFSSFNMEKIGKTFSCSGLHSLASVTSRTVLVTVPEWVRPEISKYVKNGVGANLLICMGPFMSQIAVLLI